MSRGDKKIVECYLETAGLLNRITTVEVCDATDDDSSTATGFKYIDFIIDNSFTIRILPFK